jgi:hypothetical protein
MGSLQTYNVADDSCNSSIVNCEVLGLLEVCWVKVLGWGQRIGVQGVVVKLPEIREREN